MWQRHESEQMLLEKQRQKTCCKAQCLRRAIKRNVIIQGAPIVTCVLLWVTLTSTVWSPPPWKANSVRRTLIFPPHLQAKLSIQSLPPRLVSDITPKSPRDAVRNAARAARRVGARGPPTACPAICFSFCSAPRESVIAPAQTITMWSKAHGRVRDATRPAANAKVRVYLSFAMCGWDNEDSFVPGPSFFITSLANPLCHQHFQQLPSTLGCPALSLQTLPSFQAKIQALSSPRRGFPPALSSSTCWTWTLPGEFYFYYFNNYLGCLSPALPSSILTFLRPTSLSQRILESTCPRVNTIRVSSDSRSVNGPAVHPIP